MTSGSEADGFPIDYLDNSFSSYWDCGTKDLVIENCPQIKILNIRKNLLTNLEFPKKI